LICALRKLSVKEMRSSPSQNETPELACMLIAISGMFGFMITASRTF
jgi:hypothetical protein